MTPSPTLVRLGAALLCGLACLAAGAWLGHSFTVDAAKAKAADDAKAALVDYQQRVSQGEAAVTQLQGTLREQGVFTATLQERLSHAPLLVPINRCAAVARAVHAAGGAAAGDRLGAVAGSGLRLAGAGTAAVVDLDGDSSVAASGEASAGIADLPAADAQLSLAAVSLWNSALAAQPVPAGACGADGEPAAACAAPAGIDIADAWRNHAINAASCAADRQRHQALIDYLQGQRR